MTREKEIREGIVEPICEACLPYICAHWDLPPKERLEKCKPLREWIDRIIQNLHSQGVVLRVDKDAHFGMVEVEPLIRTKYSPELDTYMEEK